jgi:hypothetical protein
VKPESIVDSPFPLPLDLADNLFSAEQDQDSGD